MADITQWLVTSSKDLRPGQLVKIPEIGLLEIMNALVINDPHMDTGLLKIDPLSFDPNATISPSDLCWIMDEMLALEYRWWCGGTLCQTVYRSLAFHDLEQLAQHPDPLVSVILRGYTIAFAKSIDLAYNELLKGHMSDGEDCWLDHYGLSVNMSDPFQSVEEVLNWSRSHAKELDEPWMTEISNRLDMRMDVLTYLALGHKAPAWRPIKRFDPSPTAKTYFADISSCVRQCMPLPPESDVFHDWDGVKQVFEDWASIPISGDEVDWRFVLRGQSYRVQMHAITRSLYKSALSPPRGTKGIDTARFLQMWISRHTSLQPDILDALYMAVPQQERRQYTIWRDLLHGYLIATLSVPLQNRARQGRTYASLSFAWYERAILAEKLSQYHPSFSQIATCLFAARLDCLLEAALAAWDLDLIGPGEERLAWWWVHLIASARVQMWQAESWESTWARVWLNIAAGMIAIVPFIPVSREVFNLRFKWALKVPHLDGTPHQSGLTPSFDKWTQSETQLRPTEAERHFLNAQDALQLLLHHLRTRKLKDFVVVVEELQQDLGRVKPGATRRRWIPAEP